MHADNMLVKLHVLPQIPDSTRLWTQAAALESDKIAQLRVLKKALERVPYSVSLWKHAIELVNEEDVKVCAYVCMNVCMYGVVCECVCVQACR